MKISAPAGVPTGGGEPATLRGVLLDLDGTLLDHDRAAAAAVRAWLPALGVAVTEAAVRLWDNVQERHFAAWRSGAISFQEQRRRRLRDFLPPLGVPLCDDDAGLDAMFEGYLRHYEQAWCVYDDVDEALTAIATAGLRTAVLTNGSTQQQNRKLSRVGLAGRVGPVWTAEDLGAPKPSAVAYHRVCERWGLPPHAVLHVGDRYDLDVEGARAAGLRAVHLDRGYTGPPGADRIGTLRDLVGVACGDRAGVEGAPRTG